MGNYLFATGAIREAEKKLFDANDMERMIDAPDANKSFRIFNELSYADELLEVDRADRYGEVLAHDLVQTRDYILSLGAETRLTELIFAPFDFHNLKAIYKARLAGREEADDLSALGMVDAGRLAGFATKRNPSAVIAPHIEEAVRRADENPRELDAPDKIDDHFDREYYVFAATRAAAIGDPRLLDLIRLAADTGNAKVALRSLKLGLEAPAAASRLVTGGSIDRYDIVRTLAAGDGAELARVIAGRLPASGLEEAIPRHLESGELWRIEIMLDNIIMAKLKEIKTGLARPAAVMAYFWGKLNAVKNIQIIMAGKLNLIPAAEIKERVRKLY